MDFARFLNLPAGRRLLNWEMARFNSIAAERIGGMAVQFGVPQMDCLRDSRCFPRKLVVTGGGLEDLPQRPVIKAPFEEVPIEGGTVDLAALPHALDFSAQPAALAAELARIMAPGGRIVLTGFCAMSLWTARQGLSRFGMGRFLPEGARPLPLFMVRHWLEAAGFSVDRGAFGCYGPASASEALCRRFDWLDKAGDRWWPQLSAVYMLSAVRRSAGMTLVGKLPASAAAARRAAAQPGAGDCAKDMQ